MRQLTPILFTALIYLLLGPSAKAGQYSEVWPGLSTLELSEMPVLGVPKKITILYNPNLAQVINKGNENEDAIQRIIAIRTRLSPSSNEKFIVEYDEGPSADPSFIVSTVHDGNKKELLQEFATTLILPGDGCAYFVGHTNNYFDQRRKFVYQQGKFSEVKQPFYSVGIKSRLISSATLYSDIELKYEVVTLHKDSTIEVVLNQGEYFLVKTNFGLLGWLKVVRRKSGIETQIEDINFAGD